MVVLVDRPSHVVEALNAVPFVAMKEPLTEELARW